MRQDRRDNCIRVSSAVTVLVSFAISSSHPHVTCVLVARLAAVYQWGKRTTQLCPLIGRAQCATLKRLFENASAAMLASLAVRFSGNQIDTSSCRRAHKKAPITTCNPFRMNILTCNSSGNNALRGICDSLTNVFNILRGYGGRGVLGQFDVASAELQARETGEEIYRLVMLLENPSISDP